MNIFFSEGKAVHKILGIVAVAVIVTSSYISIPYFFTTEKVESAATDNVSGWAFAKGSGSEPTSNGIGIGWISFNNLTDGTAIPYGVKVDLTNQATGGLGIFSGETWSENAGWISFDIARTGPSPAGRGANYSTSPTPHLAHVVWSATGGNKVTGWARALSVCDSVPCTTSGPGTNSGGWDGWVKLSNGDTSAPATPHDWVNSGGVLLATGVRIENSNAFSGWAWADDILGWIEFAPVDPITKKPVGLVVNPDGGGVCTPADPTFTIGECVLVACSAAGGEVINGWQTDSCSTGVAVAKKCYPGGTCPIPPVVPPPPPCSFASTDPLCKVGDGKCSNGENPKNSPKDCKAKWWQF